jgi:hypothetical protein
MKTEKIKAAIQEALHAQIDRGRATPWEIVTMLADLVREFERRDQRARSDQENAYFKKISAEKTCTACGGLGIQGPSFCPVCKGTCKAPEPQTDEPT